LREALVSMASDVRLLSLQASEWLILIVDGMAGLLIQIV
jgi:hypothetical protein